MVKLEFFFEGSSTIINCKNEKLKEIFKKWAKKVGKEYKVKEKRNINGKMVEYYNYEFFIKLPKILNPELTLIEQVPVKDCIIFVRERKSYSEIIYSKLKNEILEQIKKPDKKITYTESLEQLCQYGYYAEKEIEEEVANNPNNFIEIKEAIKQKETNENIYILGKLGESLEKIGIKAIIDKRNSKNKENIINNQFISSGLLNQSKYEFHINEDDIQKRDKIINDAIEKNNFTNEWKQLLSTKLDLPENEIILTNIREGSVAFDVIIKSKCLDLINKIEKLSDLTQVIKICQKNIMGACRLTPDMLDKRGNQGPKGWAKKGEKRGKLDYNPPDENWIGYGLKVLGEFENDDWIAMDGNDREWAVAYHGTSQKAVKPICSKNGKFWSTKDEGAISQKCEKFENINPLSKNKYQLCDEGAYCSPNLDYAAKYANYYDDKVVIMCRVNPYEIRIPKGKYEKEEYITDGTKNSIRPYRILFKIQK